MKRKIILFIGILGFSSCEIIWDNKKMGKEPGFSTLPCDNIEEIKVKKYSNKIDILIKQSINNLYSNDTTINYKIIGDVYHTMSLENCWIDKTTYNFIIEVDISSKKEFWKFVIKNENNRFKLIQHFRDPPNLIH